MNHNISFYFKIIWFFYIQLTQSWYKKTYTKSNNRDKMSRIWE